MAGPAELPPRVDGARLADDFTIRKVGASKREGFNKHEGKDLAPGLCRRPVTTEGRLTVFLVIRRVLLDVVGRASPGAKPALVLLFTSFRGFEELFH